MTTEAAARCEFVTPRNTFCRETATHIVDYIDEYGCGVAVRLACADCAARVTTSDGRPTGPSETITTEETS